MTIDIEVRVILRNDDKAEEQIIDVAFNTFADIQPGDGALRLYWPIVLTEPERLFWGYVLTPYFSSIPEDGLLQHTKPLTSTPTG